MARIYLDATPVLHGERAVRRNTTNLYRHLLLESGGEEYVFPYFTGRSGGRLQLEGGAKTIPIHWPGRLLQPLWLRLGWPCIEDLAGHCDLYYSPDLIFPPGRRARVLSTVRGVVYYEIPQYFSGKALRWMLTMHAYALRHSTHWLAVSESTRLVLLERDQLDPDRVFVVSHGVDPMFRPLDRAKARAEVQARFGVQRPYLLYVGVIAPHKNIRGLLRMFVHLRHTRSELDLVLVGPNRIATEEFDAALASPLLATRVRRLGAIATDDPILAALYNASEALVHLSHYEGWCAPPLEAMACGIPVVLADVPSLRELGGEAASYAPGNEPEQAASAVTRLLEDSLYREAKIRIGQRVAAAHSWARAAQKFASVLRRILEDG